MLFFIALAVVFFLCLLRGFQLIINRPRTSIKKPSFNYVFGTPGSGKTTFLAWIARLCAKEHKRIYTNVRSLSVPGADIVYIDKNQITSPRALPPNKSTIYLNNGKNLAGEKKQTTTHDMVRFINRHNMLSNKIKNDD